MIQENIIIRHFHYFLSSDPFRQLCITGRMGRKEGSGGGGEWLARQTGRGLAEKAGREVPEKEEFGEALWQKIFG